MADEQTDHDILIELKTDMGWIKVFLKDHHAHHRRLLYAGIGIITAVITAGVLNLLFA